MVKKASWENNRDMSMHTMEHSRTKKSQAMSKDIQQRPTLLSLLHTPKITTAHIQRVDQAKRLKRFQTIYFSPDCLLDLTALGDAEPNPIPDSRSSRNHSSRRKSKNTERESSDSQGGLPCPSQYEIDFVVEQLVKANYFPEHFDSLDFGVVNYSESDRSDSPTLPESVYAKSRITLPGATLVNHTGTIDDIKRLSALSATAKVDALPQSIDHDRRSRSLLSIFSSIALTDPKVNGQPIRYTSQTFEPGTNTLKVGACTFLNLPYGSFVECGLRIEPAISIDTHSDESGDIHQQGQQIRLQCVQKVVHAKTGRQAMLLCSETDVTDSFTPEVRVELEANVKRRSHLDSSYQKLCDRERHSTKLAASKMPAIAQNALEGDTLVASDLDVEQILLPSVYQPGEELPYNHHHRHHHRSFDTRNAFNSVLPLDDNADEDIWLNIAKSLSFPSPYTTNLPRTPDPSSPHRPPPTLTPLLHHLHDIKNKHRHFFIIRISPPHPKPYQSHQCRQQPAAAETAVAAEVGDRFSIPYLSAPLYQSIVSSASSVENHYLSRNSFKGENTRGEEAEERQSDILRAFKNTMAAQCSPYLFASVPDSAGAASSGQAVDEKNAEAFFQRVRLPLDVGVSLRDVEFRAGRGSGNGEKEVGMYAVPMFDDAVDSGARGGGGVTGQRCIKCWVCFLLDADTAVIL